MSSAVVFVCIHMLVQFLGQAVCIQVISEKYILRRNSVCVYREAEEINVSISRLKQTHCNEGRAELDLLNRMTESFLRESCANLREIVQSASL